ncbi:MAG TPA: hypothetical protein VFI27_16325 [candidate division Zixibacteria bacterium]|nr:hypothetical protein [candidate division Zixibacteria bacterium]
MKMRIVVPLFSAIALLIILAACGEAPSKEAKPSEDWSRGVLLGRTLQVPQAF